ncbi:MAG: hypothetical protein SFV24_19220 [Gemmatimonadales bacterium]|nr:hypothetical protein [Gemmatimonadales bacterium]
MQLTHQEIFTRVYRHLVKQNCQALEAGKTGCQYRTADGLRCAVGSLIPDDLYQPSIEGMRAGAVLWDFWGPEATGEYKAARAGSKTAAGEKALFDTLFNIGVQDRRGFQLLGDLQTIHDSMQPSAWPQSLANIAAAWQLEIPHA